MLQLFELKCLQNMITFINVRKINKFIKISSLGLGVNRRLIILFYRLSQVETKEN